MASRGIYIEIMIQTSMEQLWEHTQNPALHQQWDARFSSITYLARMTESEPQRFLYTTKLGFGLAVCGAGESVGTRWTPNGHATSALKFWSDQALSLIQVGSGYWKYIPQEHAIQFLTWYDYQVRFGNIGQIFDRFVFRPLIGWATAWSFDALRLWLEEQHHPARSIRLALTNVVIQILSGATWIYAAFSTSLFVVTPSIPIKIAMLGLGWALFIPRFQQKLQIIQLGLLLASFIIGISLPLFQHPFSVLLGVFVMLGLSIFSIINMKHVPSARRCLRRPREK